MRNTIIGLGLLGLVGCSEQPVTVAIEGIRDRYDITRNKISLELIVEMKQDFLESINQKELEKAEKQVNFLFKNKMYKDLSYGEFDVRIGKFDYNSGFDCNFYDCNNYYDFTFFLTNTKNFPDTGLELTFTFQRKDINFGEYRTGFCKNRGKEGGNCETTGFSKPAKLMARELLFNSPAMSRHELLLKEKNLDLGEPKPTKEFIDAYQTLKTEYQK